MNEQSIFVWDVFISYAKPNQDIAVTLATLLEEKGVRVWFDQITIRPGESLIDSLNEGLRLSQIGIVILSHDFFARDWPQAELKALYHLIKYQPSKKLIPIWYHINAEEVAQYSPLFVDITALSWENGVDAIVAQILDEIHPGVEHVKQVARQIARMRLALEKEKFQEEVARITRGELSLELQRFLRNLARNPLHSPNMRSRAIHVLITYNSLDKETIKFALQDSNTDFLEFIIKMLSHETHYLMEEDDLAILLRNPHLPRRSTGLGALVEKYIEQGAPYTSKVFCHASQHPSWAVKYDAVKTIIRLDDKDSIPALSCFANMSYWQARRRIALYIHRRIEQQNLSEEEKQIAVDMLTQMLTDGKTDPKTPTARYIREALQALGIKIQQEERKDEVNRKTVVLFLAAAPTDLARLRVDQEFRDIQEQLERAKLRDRFILQIKTSVRSIDLTQAILSIKPQILHFSGHGSSKGIILEDHSGRAHQIPADALASLLSQFSDTIQCVVLNACYSSEYARLLSQHIKYVIGMDSSISDKAAVAFSIGFYQALGAGVPIEKAYQFGCIQVHLSGIGEENIPLLWKKGQMLA